MGQGVVLTGPPVGRVVKGSEHDVGDACTQTACEFLCCAGLCFTAGAFTAPIPACTVLPGSPSHLTPRKTDICIMGSAYMGMHAQASVLWQSHAEGTRIAQAAGSPRVSMTEVWRQRQNSPSSWCPLPQDETSKASAAVRPTSPTHAPWPRNVVRCRKSLRRSWAFTTAAARIWPDNCQVTPHG